jgi:hypothetical protein
MSSTSSSYACPSQCGERGCIRSVSPPPGVYSPHLTEEALKYFAALALHDDEAEENVSLPPPSSFPWFIPLLLQAIKIERASSPALSTRPCTPAPSPIETLASAAVLQSVNNAGDLLKVFSGLVALNRQVVDGPMKAFISM